jgi:GTP-binding protein Era
MAAQRSGFVAVVGRPNAGKSTLINALLGERIAMVSQKANATRKRQMVIVMRDEQTQIVLVDTPGLHEKERELNRFMLAEALRAVSDCDLILFLADMSDSTENYEKFLKLAADRPHILVLSKSDHHTHEERLAAVARYQPFQDRFLALLPISATNGDNLKALLDEVANHLPEGPFYYNPEDMTTQSMREIYREMIREALFEGLSDEIPYGADVLIEQFQEKRGVDVIIATIIVERASQKGIVIGKGGSAIKRIGKAAREKMAAFAQKRIYLDLQVRVEPHWSKNKQFLKKLGYDYHE